MPQRQLSPLRARSRTMTTDRVDRDGYRAHIVFKAISPARPLPWERPMSAIAITDDLFFNRAGLDRSKSERTVADALKGGDDGELFLEFNQSEALSFDDGKLKSASFDVTQGFGLRAVAGEAHAYAHASDLTEGALKRG